MIREAVYYQFEVEALMPIEFHVDEDGDIMVIVDGDRDGHLSPGEARELANLLHQLADEAENQSILMVEDELLGLFGPY